MDFKLIEDIILELVDSEDEFFGQFLLKIKKNEDRNTEYPIYTLPSDDGFNMYFNSNLLVNYEKREIAALLKHEVYHIMNSHFERELDMKNKYCQEAITVALDISINQYINNLPPDSMKLYSVCMEYNVELREEMTAEQYAEIINNSIKKRISKHKKIEDSKRQVDIKKSHELWESKGISNTTIQRMTKKIAKNINSENIPETIKEIIKSYDKKSEISWQELLKRIIPLSKNGYKKTITRRDRRQPSRFDIRGRLPKYDINIVVALDISASMSDQEIKDILIEIFDISRVCKNSITVIECDDDVRQVYSMDSKADVKKRSRNNGSTLFSPVFEYIKKNNMYNTVLIYFTDGVGEVKLSERPINRKTIWVINGNEKFSLLEPYGEVVRINKDKVKNIEKNIGLRMVNEVIHDWAR